MDYKLISFYNKTYCQSGKFDLKKLLDDASEKASKDGPGLCLNCVKKGKVMIDKGKLPGDFH